MASRATPSAATRDYTPATLEACRRGDRAALEEVLGAESVGLERLLRRLLGPRAMVEDVLQDALEAAIRAFPSFRGEAAVSTWLARIAVRTAFHQLRRPDAQPRAPLALVEQAAAEPEPDRAAELKSALDATYHHLGALAPKKRIAFILHVFEGRPLREVAALMSASVAATKSRVFFARHELMARARHDPSLRELVAEAADAEEL